MLHGVTGPNEYENNVNNNWLTNLMAQWCLTFTLTSLTKYQLDFTKYNLSKSDLDKFKDICEKMYLPVDEKLGIFVQHDGFLDKELISKDQLSKTERPLNKNWSWDKILRSVYIKQADVLQGIYYLWDRFTNTEIKNNFDFYEQFTVHESSLSPCIHSIIAARIDKLDKAYEFYARTARLDLDNYNNDTDDGLHITSMTGSYLAIVEGFAGMMVRENKLHFTPKLPKQWEGYEFRINFRNRILNVTISNKMATIKLVEGGELTLSINDQDYLVKDVLTVNL
ncbi:glycosyl hydrolase, family 65 (trehalase) [Spiroplasma clarkii]|nr:glycosyl hydrolase family 65 protein [Spiroplasma clarkii]ARU90948.1 glycosyl hydrolase, family 65 (trehalase) [Spiroplasma clarkii]